MSNRDIPKGLTPVRMLTGSPMPGCTRYRKEASVILGIGDPVVLTGSSSIAGTNNADADGVALITRAAAASGTITGVACFFELDTASTAGRAHNTKHMAAADTGYVYVQDHPHCVFEIQEDSVGNNLVVGDVGEGVDLATVGNADTATGLSTVEIDSSSSAAQIGNADQLRLLGMVQRPDNKIGSASVTHTKWEVLINEHSYAAAQTMI